MDFPLRTEDQNHLGMFGENSGDIPEIFHDKSLLEESLENKKGDLVNILAQPGHEHTLDKFMLSFLNKKSKPKRKKKVGSVTPLLYIPSEENPSIVTIDQGMFDKLLGKKKARKKAPSNRRNSNQNAKSVLQETVDFGSNAIPWLYSDSLTIKGDDCSTDMPVDCVVCNMKFENSLRLNLHMKMHRRCINTGTRRCKRPTGSQNNSNSSMYMVQENVNSSSSILSKSGNGRLDSRNEQCSNTPCDITTEIPHDLTVPVVHNENSKLKSLMSNLAKNQLSTYTSANCPNSVSYTQVFQEVDNTFASSNSCSAFSPQIASSTAVSPSFEIQTTQTLNCQNTVSETVAGVSTKEILLQNDTGLQSGESENGVSTRESFATSKQEGQIMSGTVSYNHMTGSCVSKEQRGTNHKNVIGGVPVYTSRNRDAFSKINYDSVSGLKLNHDEIHSEQMIRDGFIQGVTQGKSYARRKICHNVNNSNPIETLRTGNTCHENKKVLSSNDSENCGNIRTVVVDVHCSADGIPNKLYDKTDVAESACISALRNENTSRSLNPKNTKCLSQRETTNGNRNLNLPENLSPNRKELESSALFVLTKLLTQKSPCKGGNSVSAYKESESLANKINDTGGKPCTKTSPCKNAREKLCNNENPLSGICHGNKNFESVQQGPSHVSHNNVCMGDNLPENKCQNKRHVKMQNDMQVEGVCILQQISNRGDNSSVANAGTANDGQNEMHNDLQAEGVRLQHQISNRGDNSSVVNTCKIAGSSIEMCQSPCTRMIHFVRQIEKFCKNRTLHSPNDNCINNGIEQNDSTVSESNNEVLQLTDTRSQPYLDDLAFHYSTKYCGIPLRCHEMTPMGDCTSTKPRVEKGVADDSSFCSRTSCYDVNMKAYRDWEKQFRSSKKHDLISREKGEYRSETQETSCIDNCLSEACHHENTISKHDNKTISSSCSDIEVVYSESNRHDFSDDCSLSANTDDDKLLYHSETDIFYDESEDQSPSKVKSKNERFMKYRSLGNILDDDSYIQFLNDTTVLYLEQDDTTSPVNINYGSQQKDYVKQSGPKDLNTVYNLQHIKIYDSNEKGMKGGGKDYQKENEATGGKHETPTVVRNLFHKFPSSREASDCENVYGLIMKLQNTNRINTSSDDAAGDDDSNISEENMEHHKSHIDLDRMAEVLDKCSRICSYSENMKRIKYNLKINQRKYKHRKYKCSKREVVYLQSKEGQSRHLSDKTKGKEDRVSNINKGLTISHEKQIQEKEGVREVTHVSKEKKSNRQNDRKRISKETYFECSPHKCRKDEGYEDSKFKERSSQKCKDRKTNLQTHEIIKSSKTRNRKKGNNPDKQQCDFPEKGKIDIKLKNKKNSVKTSPKISQKKFNRQIESSRQRTEMTENEINTGAFERKTNSRKSSEKYCESTEYKGIRKSPRKYQQHNYQKLSNNTGCSKNDDLSKSPGKFQNYGRNKDTFKMFSAKHCNKRIESPNRNFPENDCLRKSPRKCSSKNKCSLSCCTDSTVQNSKHRIRTLLEVSCTDSTVQKSTHGIRTLLEVRSKGVTKLDYLDRDKSKEGLPKREDSEYRAKKGHSKIPKHCNEVDPQSSNKAKGKKSPIKLKKSPIKSKKSPSNKTVAKKNDDRKKERKSPKIQQRVKKVDEQKKINRGRLQVKMFGGTSRRQRDKEKEGGVDKNAHKAAKFDIIKSDNHKRIKDSSSTVENKICHNENRNMNLASKSSGVSNSIQGHPTVGKHRYKTPEKIDIEVSSSKDVSEINRKKHTTPKKRWQALFLNEVNNSQYDYNYSEYFSKERNLGEADYSSLDERLTLFEKDSPSPCLSEIDIVKTPERSCYVLPHNKRVASPTLPNNRNEIGMQLSDNVDRYSNDSCTCARFIHYSRMRNSSRTLPISEQM